MVPAEKLVEYEVSILAVNIEQGRVEPDRPKMTGFAIRSIPDTTTAAPAVDDDLAPGETTIVREKLRFRKLDVGDRVKKGQLLGIDQSRPWPWKTWPIKQAKVEAAAADVLATARAEGGVGAAACTRSTRCAPPTSGRSRTTTGASPR